MEATIIRGLMAKTRENGSASTGITEIPKCQTLVKRLFYLLLDNVDCNLGRFQRQIKPVNFRIGVFTPFRYLPSKDV